jgi:iron complex transport system ATP-binding protein
VTEPMLVVERLSVERAGRRVLSEIDFAAFGGQILAVLGPNGAGKSTLLRAVIGLQAFGGVVRLGGEDLAALAPAERAKRVAFVPQQSALRSALPVREVVLQGRYVHRSSAIGQSAADRSAVTASLEMVDGRELASRPFTQLSLGEQRRVLIARALCTGARLLCLDEPTSALDVRHGLELHRLLRELAQRGHAVLVVLHQLEEALRHADRALLLQAGTIASSGPVSEVIASGTVRAVYGVDMLSAGGLAFRLPVDAP